MSKLTVLCLLILTFGCSGSKIFVRTVGENSVGKYCLKQQSVDGMEIKAAIKDTSSAEISIVHTLKGKKWEYTGSLAPFYGRKTWTDSTQVLQGWRNETVTLFGCDETLCISYVWNRFAAIEKLGKCN